MSKVTSKLQITIPKAIAERHGIRPGDEVDWQDAGGGIRLVPPARRALPVKERLRLLEQARARARDRGAPPAPTSGRGWTRDELYEDRGRSR